MTLSELTDEKIDALDAGPEMDRLVASLLDVPVCVTNGECRIGYNYRTGCGVSGAEVEFSPSADWNDAMFAAEKSELLNRLSLIRNAVNGVWQYVLFTWDQKTIAYDRSGPLAICRAILKLANAKRHSQPAPA